MEHLSIDIETYSSEDIGKVGLYKYAQSPDFEILLFSYSIDFGEVRIIDLAQGESIPETIAEALRDVDTIKHAYNAAFEWFCLNTEGYTTPLSSWRCTMFHGLYMGYPSGLAAVGSALGLPQDKQKDKAGKALIKYFSCPCKPTKVNGGRTRNYPKHDMEKWNLYKKYNIQDVVTEIAVYKRFEPFPVPPQEQYMWELDVRTNATGVKVDMELVEGVLDMVARYSNKLMAESAQITKLDNPNSAPQLLTWLRGQGVELNDLTKDTVASLLDADLPDHVHKVLANRKELAKTSTKKYNTMEACAGPDDRVRGILQVYGANRTGRWAGRLVQVQNLPRNYIKTLDLARDLSKQANLEGLELIYGSALDTMSQLIRTAFIPRDEHKFVVADFSAIEARVIAWLASEKWVQDVFATHGRIYEATASQMFGVDIDLIKKGNPEYALRQKGKVATLALGYQGGTSALIAMGALDMGLNEDELPDIVKRWRKANPHIVGLWHTIEDASLEAMLTGKTVEIDKGVSFRHETNLVTGGDFLTVRLPSDRELHYVHPVLKENRFGKQAIHYMDLNQTNHKWCENSTYGGKLTENIVQAIARDCLAVTMKRLDKRYHNSPVVMHIHDEVVMDAEMDVTVDEICNLMAEPIPWASGLILKAAGFESPYYMKD